MTASATHAVDTPPPVGHIRRTHFFPEIQVRALLVVSLLGMLACASGKSDPGTVQPTSVPMVMGSNLRVSPINRPHTTTLAVPLDRVWKALPVAYDSLGLPLTVLDSKRHLIGNQGFKIRQKLGAVRLSEYIDCGSAQIGLSADSYDVFLSVVTEVRSTAQGSEFVTTVEASARPITFAQEYGQCKTKSVLESRLAELVKAMVVR